MLPVSASVNWPAVRPTSCVTLIALVPTAASNVFLPYGQMTVYWPAVSGMSMRRRVRAKTICWPGCGRPLVNAPSTASTTSDLPAFAPVPIAPPPVAIQ